VSVAGQAVCCTLYITVSDAPVYVAEADESTDWTWINDLPRPRDSDNYTLNVVWTGRYKSDARYEDA